MILECQTHRYWKAKLKFSFFILYVSCFMKNPNNLCVFVPRFFFLGFTDYKLHELTNKSPHHSVGKTKPGLRLKPPLFLKTCATYTQNTEKPDKQREIYQF